MCGATAYGRGMGLPVRGDELARLRLAVSVFFMLDGFLFANWVVRVPQVKQHIGASAGGLGLALLGVSAGAVVTMVVTGRLCSRFGSRRLTLITGVALSLTMVLPGLMPNVVSLSAALFVFGAAYGGLNVAMNSVAVDITRRLGRPVMPTFHAAYSFGGLSGAVVGGLAAEVLGPEAHLSLAGLVGLVVTVAAGLPVVRSTVLDAPVPENADAPRAVPSGGRIALLVVVFGTIAGCSAYGEGALADWGALHLRADLHTSPGLAAAAYGGFSVAMLAGRLSGTWLLGRLGRTTVLVAGGLAAGGGTLVAAFTPVLAVAVVGFVIVGLGLANLFPAALAQAGALTGPSGVATASTIGYAGMLAGPPVIGFVADRTGLPIALTSITVLAVLASATALLAGRMATRAEQAFADHAGVAGSGARSSPPTERT